MAAPYVVRTFLAAISGSAGEKLVPWYRAGVITGSAFQAVCRIENRTGIASDYQYR